MDQEQRDIAMVNFKKKKSNILVVTDLAARGIDIPMLNNVIHYDYPPSMKLFIHRSGRTARAGSSGTSYTLLTTHEIPFLVETNLYVGRKYVCDVHSLEPSEKEDALNNPIISLYGTLSQTMIDSYNAEIKRAYEKNIMIEEAEKPMKNALIKYNKHKNSASVASVKTAKELGDIGIHPLVLSKVTSEDAAIMNLQDQIRKFRPKQNVIEHMYLRAKQTDELESFQKIVRKQKHEVHRAEIMKLTQEQARKLDIEKPDLVKQKVDEYNKNEQTKIESKKVQEEEEQVHTKKHMSKRDRKLMKKVLAFYQHFQTINFLDVKRPT